MEKRCFGHKSTQQSMKLITIYPIINSVMNISHHLMIDILIGYIISAETEGKVSAFITAFAAGTFTYVAVMEVIATELKNRDVILVKVLALVVGFGLMSMIATFL
jgi:zinc transporter ZupT